MTGMAAVYRDVESAHGSVYELKAASYAFGVLDNAKPYPGAMD